MHFDALVRKVFALLFSTSKVCNIDKTTHSEAYSQQLYKPFTWSTIKCEGKELRHLSITVRAQNDKG